jgi:hypothetical protein
LANKKSLIPFSKGFDPRRNTKGPPRKFISAIANLGYTNREVADAIRNLAALTEAELKEVDKNTDCTVLERTIARALLTGLKKGSLYNLEVIITRAFGKPQETTAAAIDNKIEVIYVKGKTIT